MTERIHEHQLKRKLYRSNTTVCNNIRLLRIICGYTQMEIASLLKLSRSAYFAIEIGKKLPDFDMLNTLSEFYDVDIDYMVSFDIAGQMLNMIRVDHAETKATRFIERYFTLSHKGRCHIREEIYRMKACEDKYKRFPWKYDERPDLFSPSVLNEKERVYERRHAALQHRHDKDIPKKKGF